MMLPESWRPQAALPARGSRGNKVPLLLLLIAFAALAVGYGVAVPPFEGPDEDDHFRYARYLAERRALPVQRFEAGGGEAGHQGWQPPLYYVLAALVISPVDTSDFQERLWRNPAASYQGDPACCGRNLYFHTRAEDWPFSQTTLAVRLARLISAAFGILTVATVYSLARRVLTAFEVAGTSEEPVYRLSGTSSLTTVHWPALGAAALVAFNPSFLYASALVSNDAPLAALATLTLLGCVEVWRGERALGPRTAFCLGLWLALGFLTKTTALGLIPFTLAVLATAAWRQAGPRETPAVRFRAAAHPFLRAALVLLGVWILLCGWYLARNLVLYGDPFALRLINASALLLREAPLTRAELFQISLPWLWRTFWGGPVPGDFSSLWLNTLALLFLAAGLGLAIVGAQNLRAWRRGQGVPETALVYVLLAGWLGFILAAQVQFMRTSGGTDQGRYLFPAIAAIAILVTRGLYSLLAVAGLHGRRAAAGLALTLAGVLLALAVYVPFAYVRPAFARPLPLTEAALEEADYRLEASFGALALRGYRLDRRAAARGESLRVTLYWQALEPMDESYRVFVHLVDEKGRVGGGKDVIPVRGAYATVLWSPGEWVADAVEVPIDLHALPGRYQLEIGLYPFGQPDHRLNLAGSEEDRVLVDEIEIR